MSMCPVPGGVLEWVGVTPDQALHPPAVTSSSGKTLKQPLPPLAALLGHCQAQHSSFKLVAGSGLGALAAMKAHHQMVGALKQHRRRDLGSRSDSGEIWMLAFNREEVVLSFNGKGM